MDPILYWNDVALEANRVSHTDRKDTQTPGPTLSSRALAIVHLAMYDAFVGASQAARIMKLTPGRIRQMLRASEVDRGVAVVRTEEKVKGVPEAHIFIAPRLQAFALPIIQGIRFFPLLS